MAEPTEQEQLKTNQHLTKIESAAAETSGKIDDLISAVKQPATYETDLLKEIKDQGEEQAQTDKKTLKSQREFHQEIKELTKNSGVEKVHNRFMETMTKKRLAIEEATLKDKKREDKLATREDGGVSKFIGKRWDSFKKSAGDWLGNVGKLLALIGAFALLQWLKGRDLVKDWKQILEYIKEMSQKIKDWGKKISEAISDTDDNIPPLISAWKGMAISFSSMSSMFKGISGGISRWFGPDAELTRKLSTLDSKVKKLTSQKAAIQRALNVADELGEGEGKKQSLAKKLGEVETKLKATLAQKAAAENARKFANALNEESRLAKQLSDVNDALEKAGDPKAKSLPVEGERLGKNLKAGSPAAKLIGQAADEVSQLTQKRGAIEELIRLNRNQMKDILAIQENLDKSAAATQSKPSPAAKMIGQPTPIEEQGKPYQKQMKAGEGGKRWFVKMGDKEYMIGKEAAANLTKQYNTRIATTPPKSSGFLSTMKSWMPEGWTWQNFKGGLGNVPGAKMAAGAARKIPIIGNILAIGDSFRSFVGGWEKEWNQFVLGTLQPIAEAVLEIPVFINDLMAFIFTTPGKAKEGSGILKGQWDKREWGNTKNWFLGNLPKDLMRSLSKSLFGTEVNKLSDIDLTNPEDYFKKHQGGNIKDGKAYLPMLNALFGPVAEHTAEMVKKHPLDPMMAKLPLLFYLTSRMKGYDIEVKSKADLTPAKITQTGKTLSDPIIKAFKDWGDNLEDLFERKFLDRNVHPAGPQGSTINQFNSSSPVSVHSNVGAMSPAFLIESSPYIPYSRIG